MISIPAFVCGGLTCFSNIHVDPNPLQIIAAEAVETPLVKSAKKNDLDPGKSEGIDLLPIPTLILLIHLIPMDTGRDANKPSLTIAANPRRLQPPLIDHLSYAITSVRLHTYDLLHRDPNTATHPNCQRVATVEALTQCQNRLINSTKYTSFPPPCVKEKDFASLCAVRLNVEMAYLRSAKNSVGYIFREVTSCRPLNHTYTSQAFRTNQMVNTVNAPFSLYSISLRRFGSEVSGSEQLNLIKKLRERTSAPIKDVKISLVNCDWDIEAAQKDLRKRGILLASKKSSRTATEGLLALAQTEDKAVVIELNCETDFVARNDIFQHLASCLARAALTSESSTKPIQSFGSDYFENMNINLNHPKLRGESTVKSAITEVAAMVGENVKFRRGVALSTSSHGIVCTYLHTCPQPGLGRIAGMLTLETEDKNASLEALHNVGSSLAMHIVAAKPLFMSKDLVSSEALESERDILKSQVASSGKPENIIQKMVEGRLKKYYEDVVLLEQKYIMDDTVKIQSLLNNLSKEVGSTVKIGDFIRMEVGEGIQSVEASTDSADAVAQSA